MSRCQLRLSKEGVEPMRVDTLSYNYQMNVRKRQIYEVIHEEQQRYFQSNGFSNGKFQEGAEISLTMPSKLGTTKISAIMRLSKLNENEIELITSYNKGNIIQHYILNERSASKTQVTYSERNTFHQSRNQYSFIFLALLYKFFYNSGMKKRMIYLEKRCRINEEGAN